MATGRTGCPLQPPPLPLAAGRQHRAQRDEERCPCQGLPELSSPPAGCAPHPRGVSPACAGPPLLPTAGATCSHAPTPPSPPTSLPSASLRAPWTQRRRGSPPAPRLRSRHPWTVPADLGAGCPFAYLLPISSVPSGPAASPPPHKPQRQHLSPLLTTCSPHIYISTVNPCLPKPAEAFTFSSGIPASSQGFPPPSLLLPLTAQPYTQVPALIHTQPVPLLSHRSHLTAPPPRVGRDPRDRAGHNSSERRVWRSGGVGRCMWVGGLLGSLSPDKLNTSQHSYCSSNNKRRQTIAPQRQTEIISLFRAILSK